jgi:hypothetical protein
MHFDSLVNHDDWEPMELEEQQFSPYYFWHDGRPLKDAPVDFAKTFDGAMFTSLNSIDVMAFNRNPLKVIPNFVVPRHHHTTKEMIFVFAGQYSIDHGEGADRETTVVKPGQCFLSLPGTPYTMTAGPEGVVYIETWPDHIMGGGFTFWYDVGWVHR